MATSAFGHTPSGTSGDDLQVRTSEPPKLHPVQRIRELLATREITSNLVRKDVKVKYKSSVLGAVWSMLNPILYLAVFSLVFAVVLPASIPNFPVYLLTGLLAWNLFATSLTLASRSVVDNANLVTKVYFPREILPLSAVGSALYDFVLQAIVLAGFLVLFRYNFLGLNLLLLPLSILALLALTTALSLWVAAFNVRYRDTQHLLNIGLLAWFWVTPVVYPSFLVWHKFGDSPLLLNLYLANPMADIVLGFQRSIYRSTAPTVVRNGVPGHVAVLAPVSIAWLAMLLAAVLLGSLVLLWLTWGAFFRLSGDFAEEV